MQSIMIADSHNLCREALCSYIRQANPDYRVDDAGSYKEMIGKIETSPPDLLLIDTDLHDLSPDQSVWADDIPDGVKIGVILPLRRTEFQGPDDIISGLFPKSLSCKAFLRGVDQILEGGTFFPPLKDHADHLQHIAGGTNIVRHDFHLTAREKEVLSYLVKGASNKDIARALDLQVVTVKLHVRGICRKLKAANRTQAALLAKENGWG